MSASLSQSCSSRPRRMPEYTWKSEGNYRKSDFPGEDRHVLTVRIEHPTVGEWFEAKDAIVDTGSPICMLPEKVAKDLVLIQWTERQLYTMDGASYDTPVYYAHVAIQGWASKIEAVSFGRSPGDLVIVGRSHLNRVATLLDGPNRTLKLGQRNPG